ncbi:MAG TPA: chromosomal replication initiator protein DnaA [Anaerolineales bacterium]|nr:chromosomal replication initiator protein DnaA [Anaerolineales bacterium]
MKPEQIWQAALGELQIQLTKATYDTWLRDTRYVAFEDNVFFIGTPTGYAKDWLENRLYGTIRRTLQGISRKTVDVKFSVWANAVEGVKVVQNLHGDPTPKAHAKSATVAAPSHFTSDGRILNSKYRFENYIVGKSNRLAHAACIATAENPATAYNPLFLHGGVGLGKTHLLQAIGNYCAAQGMTVLYVSAEDFANELISSIRSHSTENFREKYRKIDVLLMDDVQFIAGKDATQEEFFHTFNALHQNNKQLVLSSDRHPKSFNTLEERLRSRFEWGLTVDIQPPDLETRIAILQSKAEERGREVPADVLDLLARRVQSNIRELEGALNRLLANADLLKMPMNAQLVDHTITEWIPSHQTPTPDAVLKAVAETAQVSLDELKGPSRKKEIAQYRQMAMFLLREEAEQSLPEIGNLLGGRDHTTIKYGHEKIKDEVECNSEVRRMVSQMKERIYNRR